MSKPRLTTTDISAMRYVSLVTFRRSGTPVQTAIWIAGHADTLYGYSEGHAGKVKRIRANGKVQLAACDLRGKVLSEFVDANARIVTDSAERVLAFAALKKKYGWQMVIANFLSRLSGKYAKRAVIALRLA